MTESIVEDFCEMAGQESTMKALERIRLVTEHQLRERQRMAEWIDELKASESETSDEEELVYEAAAC